jgi:phage tail sheath protein FI
MTMAIFTPSESPAVTFKEIDLTGNIPNVQTTTGVIVGDFNWGPISKPTQVSNENELASTFGTPNTTNNIDYFSATQYLRYSNSLYVVRETTAAARNAANTAGNAIKLNDKEAFDAATFTGDAYFLARYAGTHGNSLKVEYSKAGATRHTNTAFDTEFDTVSAAGEINVLVTDEDGVVSGVAGTVLERFAYLSTTSGVTTADGTDNYYKNVINERSSWIYATMDSDGTLDSSAAISLTGGVNSGTLTAGSYDTGFNKIASTENYEVDFLIAPGMADDSDQAQVVTTLTGIASSTRKDCIVVASPNRTAIVNVTNPATAVTNTTTCVAAFPSSSYLVADNNYVKTYDKYNDKYIFIPAASSTAGVMALSDLNAGPWYSPAGQRRGQYFGVAGLAYNATKAQRDTLYKAGVNPIVNIAGTGVILFGDKTRLTRPSAFDRINVRRLFLAIERAIGRAAENVMFEFNDEFTRAEFTNIVEPFLREIKGRRGITDFKVLCDETNNTAAVVDRNEFIASLFIKPARSINYVTLNFVAVRTGVSFDEVVGTV